MPLPIWPCTFSRYFTPRGVNPKKKKRKIRNQKQENFLLWLVHQNIWTQINIQNNKKKDVVLKFLLYSIFLLFFFTVASHLVGPQHGPPLSALGSSGPKKEKPRRSNLSRWNKAGTLEPPGHILYKRKGADTAIALPRRPVYGILYMPGRIRVRTRPCPGQRTLTRHPPLPPPCTLAHRPLSCYPAPHPPRRS